MFSGTFTCGLIATKLSPVTCIIFVGSFYLFTFKSNSHFMPSEKPTGMIKFSPHHEHSYSVSIVHILMSLQMVVWKMRALLQCYIHSSLQHVFFFMYPKVTGTPKRFTTFFTFMGFPSSMICVCMCGGGRWVGETEGLENRSKTQKAHRNIL